MVRAAGVWIVWCPSSDLHILGRTITRDVLLSYPPIALGSDSPLSANGDLIDELRAAREAYDLPAELLYRRVTTRPARLLKLPAQHGSIAKGGPPDLLIVQDTGQTPCECLVSLAHKEILEVLHRGEIVVASMDLFRQDLGAARNLHTCVLRQGLQWHIAAPAEGFYLPHSPSGSAIESPTYAEVIRQ